MFGYVDEIRKKVEIESGLASYPASDTLAMQIMALTCIKNSIKGQNKKALEKKIDRAVHLGSKKFLKAQINDSTFGENEVTAALASQVRYQFHVTQIFFVFVKQSILRDLEGYV